MPYISSETVKQKREALKKAFPDFKFSIIKEHYSSICVSILEAPVLMTESKYETVNPYYIKEHYAGKAQEVLLKIYSIINSGNYTEVEDGDYGFVPSFYTHIYIGHYDKPFKYIINGTNGKAVAGIKIKEVKS